MRATGWVLTGSVTGVVLGALDSVVNHVTVWIGQDVLARGDRGPVAQAADLASFVLDSGWGWAAVAVLAGWLVSRDRPGRRGVLTGAAAGGIALVVATVVYYAMDVVFDGGAVWTFVTQFWVVRGVVLGLPLGAVGAAIHRPGWVGLLAALVVPAGAVLNVIVLPPPPESPMTVPLLVGIGVGALTVLVLAVTRFLRSPVPPQKVTPQEATPQEATQEGPA